MGAGLNECVKWKQKTKEDGAGWSLCNSERGEGGRELLISKMPIYDTLYTKQDVRMVSKDRNAMG